MLIRRIYVRLQYVYLVSGVRTKHTSVFYQTREGPQFDLLVTQVRQELNFPIPDQSVQSLASGVLMQLYPLQSPKKSQ